MTWLAPVLSTHLRKDDFTMAMTNRRREMAEFGGFLVLEAAAGSCRSPAVEDRFWSTMSTMVHLTTQLDPFVRCCQIHGFGRKFVA